MKECSYPKATAQRHNCIKVGFEMIRGSKKHLLERMNFINEISQKNDLFWPQSVQNCESIQKLQA